MSSRDMFGAVQNIYIIYLYSYFYTYSYFLVIIYIMVSDDVVKK